MNPRKKRRTDLPKVESHQFETLEILNYMIEGGTMKFITSE
jgi:hypothetical protein